MGARTRFMLKRERERERERNSQSLSLIFTVIYHLLTQEFYKHDWLI